jgi:ABC-type amino acid transport substrate-binding protein
MDSQRIQRLVGRRPCRWFAGILTALLLHGAASTPAFAQDAPPASAQPIKTLKAGLHISPPFVMRTDKGYMGMAVDLWKSLAAEHGIATEFVEYPTVRDLVDAASAGEVDVAVTNLTITKKRAERIDFTHPWYDAGLQIMISDVPRIGFDRVFQGLADTGHLRVYAWIAGIVLAATVLLTLFDRRFDPAFPKRWRDGAAESFYTVMSVAVSGKPPPRAKLFGWIGRIWAGLWLICGVAVLAYVTSTVTSVMTTIALIDRISGLSDLPGKAVGVLTGSTAEDFAAETGLSTVSFANMDTATDALIGGRIDAIVGDAPVLDYFTYKNPDRDLAVVGDIFEPDKYGFGLASGSALTRPVTVVLLGAEESGLIEELRTKYFGAAQ